MTVPRPASAEAEQLRIKIMTAYHTAISGDADPVEFIESAIADALRQAEARGRSQGLEEAAQRMESLIGNEIIFNTIWTNLAAEFRRRALPTEGEGR